jgi:hypothetical protein
MASLFLVVDEMGPPGVSKSNRAALDDDDGTANDNDDGLVSYMGGGEEGRSTSNIMPP